MLVEACCLVVYVGALSGALVVVAGAIEGAMRLVVWADRKVEELRR